MRAANARGGIRQQIPHPYEKLQTIETWESHLKLGVSAERLAQQAAAMADLESAKPCKKLGTNCCSDADPILGSGAVQE